jgi:hypothetical protein
VTLKTSPNFRIGTSIREKYYLKDKFKHDLPPPDSYNPKMDSVKWTAPSAGIGYGNRGAFNKTMTTPGPGTY